MTLFAAPNTLDVTWQWLAFDQLSPHALYALLALRHDVFVMEQQCLFTDMDDADQGSLHLLGWQGIGSDRRLVAYLRCVPPGVKYAEASIGRVVCARATRGTGLGKLLFAEGLRQTMVFYPDTAIRIGAQQRLEKFYASFGFTVCSEAYLEDGIWHVEMQHPGAV